MERNRSKIQVRRDAVVTCYGRRLDDILPPATTYDADATPIYTGSRIVCIFTFQMNDVFVLAGASVDTEVLDLFEIVLDILKETRRRGEGLIRGRDLWSQVSEKDARLLRCVSYKN